MNFQQNWVSRLIISNMHHRITLMYINFQKNQVSRIIQNRAHTIICNTIYARHTRSYFHSKKAIQ